MKTIRIIILLLVVAGAAALVVWWNTSPKADRVSMESAKIKEISAMVQLCSVEFYEDVPLKAAKGPRHFFGRMTVTGSIGFDIENIAREMRGDTLFVTLPREIITIRESTDPGSYKVIDTWTDKLFGSSNFTTVEENEIKTKTLKGFKDKLYADGTVAKARREAVANLATLLEVATGKTAIVTDPTPEGVRGN